MKKILLFGLFLGVSLCFAQGQKTLDSLTADANWREYYDQVSAFENGQAIAKVYGKEVLLDKDGKQLIPLRYDKVTRYVENMAWVCLDGLCGTINRKGKIKTPLQYTSVMVANSKNWVFAQNRNECFLFDSKGRILKRFQNIEVENIYRTNYFWAKKDGFMGIIDSNGNYLIPAIYDNVKSYSVYNSFDYPNLIASKNGQYGVVDINNKVVIPFEFDEIRKENLGFQVKKNNKFGFFGLKGNLLAPIQYQNVVPYYSSGVLCEKINQIDYDFYFKNGKIIQNIVGCEGGKNSNAFLKHQDHKTAYYDSLGNVIIPPLAYENLESCDTTDFIIATKNNKIGVIKPDNQIVIPFEYEHLKHFSDKEKQLFIAKKGNKYGVINLQNQVKIPFDYDLMSFIWYINNQLCLRVTKNDRYGILDLDGKVLLDTIYDFIDYNQYIQITTGAKTFQVFPSHKAQKWYDYHRQFNTDNGKLRYNISVKDSLMDIYNNKDELVCENIPIHRQVESPNSWDKNDYSSKPLDYLYTKHFIYYFKNGKWGGTRHDGTALLPFEYDSAASSGFKQMIFLKKDKKVALFNHLEGKMMTAFYDSIRVGYVGVLVKKGGKWGYLDWNMKPTVPCEYDKLIDLYESKAILAKKGGFYGLIDIKNNVLQPFIYQNGGLHQAETGLVKRSHKNKQIAFILKNDEKSAYFDSYGKESNATHISSKYLVLGKITDTYYLNSLDHIVKIRLKNDSSANTIGIYDTQKQKVLVPCKYSYIECRNKENMFFLRKEISTKINKNGKDTIVKYSKSGIYDYNLDKIHPCIYDEIEFQERMITLRQDSLTMIYNNSGKLIFQGKTHQKPTVYYSYSTLQNYFSFGKDSLKGLFDYYGNQILPSEFSDFHEKRNDTFIVSKNGKYGVVTRENTIIPCQYDRLQSLDYKHFIIEKTYDKKGKYSPKYGVINTKNDTILALEYDYISGFDKNGKADIRKGRLEGYLDENLTPIYPDHAINRYEEYHVAKFSSTDSLILANDYPIVELHCPEEEIGGDCDFGRYDRYRDCKGYINTKGKWIIPVHYWEAKRFEEGFAAVQIKTKWGYINLKDELVIPCQYDNAACFKNGFALVRQDTNCYFINKKGEKSSPIYTVSDTHDYYEPHDFSLALSDTLLPLRYKNGMVEIDSSKINFNVYHTEKEYVEQEIKNGFLDEKELSPCGLVTFQDTISKLWGVKNAKGKIIIPAKIYDNYGISIGDSMIINNNRPLHYLYDYEGNVLEKSENSLSFLGEGIVFIDWEGLMRFPNGSKKATSFFKYGDHFGLFDNSLLLVHIDNDIEDTRYNDYPYSSKYLYGLADKNDKLVVPMEYFKIRPLNEGLYAVLKGDKWGYINQKNEIIIPFIYDAAFDFKNGKAIVGRGHIYHNSSDMTYGIINKKGELLLPFMFDNLEREGERYFKFGNQIIDELGRLVKE